MKYKLKIRNKDTIMIYTNSFDGDVAIINYIRYEMKEIIIQPELLLFADDKIDKIDLLELFHDDYFDEYQLILCIKNNELLAETMDKRTYISELRETDNTPSFDSINSSFTAYLNTLIKIISSNIDIIILDILINS